MDPKFAAAQNRNRQMAAKMVRRVAPGGQRTGGMGMGDTPQYQNTGGTYNSGNPQAPGASQMAQKFDHGILSGFQPGNIGDINRVIWPFWFTFSTQNISPGQSFVASFSVTQEAGFLMRYVTKQVYTVDPITQFMTYIDPFNFNEDVNSANGLVVGMKDAQSSREFYGRSLQDIDMWGSANFPTYFPSAVFLLPNQTMQLTLSNNSATETYVPFVSVVGYRVRVQDAQKILSTVSG